MVLRRLVQVRAPVVQVGVHQCMVRGFVVGPRG